MLGDMGSFGVPTKRFILNVELTAKEDNNTSEMILLVGVIMSGEMKEFQRQRFIEMSSRA